jgi:YHS domain-containing protein
MEVNMKSPPGGTWEHAGETYYFCGPGCNRAFQKEPEAYLSGDKKLDMEE